MTRAFSLKISLKKREERRRLILFFITLLASCILLFPIYWMVRISVSPQDKLFAMPPDLIITRINWEGYQSFFTRPIFLRFYLNSIIVAVGTVLLSLFAGTCAGYSFSRFRYKGRKMLMVITLSAQMFPWALLLISLYISYIYLGLLNTYLGLILSHSTFALPLTIWIIKGYFDSIPMELEQSAAIDGCSRTQALIKIILPLAKPGITAAGIYIFLFSWNDFLFGLTLTTKDTMRILSPGISMQFIGEFEFLWIDMMSSSVLITIPIVMLFLIFQKYFIQGLTAGAVKG
jgi:multiple sugar transport system permease protein